MVKACSGSVLPLLLVLAWQLPLPPTHSFPLNLPARVPTLPEGSSYKDSLLSGKDFLSVFVSRSSHLTAASAAATTTTTTAHPTSAPDGRLASPTSTTTPSAPSPLDATPEDATPSEGEEECPGGGPCSPRVISVRVSSSVSGTTPRREGERTEPPSPNPTPSPARSIFTSFLDAFAESSGRGRSRTSLPSPTPPTLLAEAPSADSSHSEDHAEGAAVTYEVSVSRGVSRGRSEGGEEGGEGDEGDRVADEFVPLTPTPKSRYEFSPSDRLQFTSLPPSPPSPYPRAGQEERERSYAPRNLESYDLDKSYESVSSGITFQIPDKEQSLPESTSISLVEGNIDVSGDQQESGPVEPVDTSTRDRLHYSTGRDSHRSQSDPGSNFETRYQSLQQSVIAQEAEGDGSSYDSSDVPGEESSQEIAYSPSLHQRRRQKSLYHHYLRHQFPRESGYASAGRQHEAAAFEQQFAGSEASYLVPEGHQSHQSHREPEEMNYEVAEEVSVMSRGRVHGLQPTSSQSSPPVTGDPDSLRVFDRDLDARKAAAANQKFGYVVEGRNYRKYRVEERTSDGFIVGEYGVVNHDDGVLRGVRYTADGTINPRLIYEALMKFLSL